MQNETANPMNWLTSYPIANKGVYDNNTGIPENSVPAFQRAIALNYGIRLDVQLTESKELVVFSDQNLERLCGIDREIQTLDKRTMKHYSLLKSNEKIPVFQDVLRLVKGKVPLIIEVKTKFEIRRIARVLENCLLDYRGHFAVLSSDPLLLGWFAQNAPMVTRGQLLIEDQKRGMRLWHHIVGTKAISSLIHNPAFVVTSTENIQSSRVSDAKKSGKLVLVSHVYTQEVCDSLNGICDNIIFDGFLPITDQHL
jgi:glycerophosphoryl diester phosphodiesterase